jgi:hypothetical protein
MMKKKLYSTFAMLSLLFTLSLVYAQAQSATALKVTIPFEFQIGSQVLPPGEYSIKRLSQNSIFIRSEDGEAKAIAVTTSTAEAGADEKGAQEKLVFHQYGNQYFLSQVWMVRGGEGRELNQTDAERQAAKGQNLAGGGAKAKRVEVAARAH